MPPIAAGSSAARPLCRGGTMNPPAIKRARDQPVKRFSVILGGYENPPSPEAEVVFFIETRYNGDWV